MANESRVFVKLGLVYKSNWLDVDFDDSSFNDFNSIFSQWSYGGNGYYNSDGEFNLVGKWTFDMNLEWKHEIENFVNELNDVLAKKKLKASYLVGYYNDIEWGAELRNFGRFIIDIDNRPDNLNLYKVTTETDTPDFPEKEDNLTEDQTYEYEQIIEEKFDMLVRERYKIDRTYDFNNNLLILKEEDTSPATKISKKYSNQLETLFDIDFILDQIVESTPEAIELLEKYKSELVEVVYRKSIGWDLTWFHIIRALVNDAGLNPRNKQLLVENVGKIIITLFPYIKLSQVNHRGENIYSCFSDMSKVTSITDYLRGQISSEYTNQFSTLLTFLISQNINPMLNNWNGLSFYDLLNQKRADNSEFISIIESSEYFNNYPDIKKPKYYCRLVSRGSEKVESYFGKLISDNWKDLIPVVKKGEIFNSSLFNNINFLMISILLNRTELSIALIESGIDINMVSIEAIEQRSLYTDPETSKMTSYKTALMLAIFTRNSKVIQSLLDHEANVTQMTPSFETAIHFAILNQDLELVNELMLRGATLQYNEVRKNHGLGDSFSEIHPNDKNFKPDFWKAVYANGWYKQGKDEYGNGLMFTYGSLNKSNKEILSKLISRADLDRDWLTFTDIPETKQNEELIKDLNTKTVSEIAVLIKKRKLNYNSKAIVSNPNGVKITSGSFSIDNTKPFVVPLILQYFVDAVKNNNEKQLENFIDVALKYSQLGYSIETTDSAVSNLAGFNSCGGRNFVLTLLSKAVEETNKSKRSSLLNATEKLLDNGGNINAFDNSFNSVLDYLGKMFDVEKAKLMYHKYLCLGALSAKEQIENVGLYHEQKYQHFNDKELKQETLRKAELKVPFENIFNTHYKVVSFVASNKGLCPIVSELTDEQSDFIVLLSQREDDKALKLLKDGFDWRYSFDNNVNLLQTAIMFQNPKTAKYLIENEIDLSQVTDNKKTGDLIFEGKVQTGLTALGFAELTNSTDLIKILKNKLK